MGSICWCVRSFRSFQYIIQTIHRWFRAPELYFTKSMTVNSLLKSSGIIHSASVAGGTLVSWVAKNKVDLMDIYRTSLLFIWLSLSRAQSFESRFGFSSPRVLFLADGGIFCSKIQPYAMWDHLLFLDTHYSYQNMCQMCQSTLVSFGCYRHRLLIKPFVRTVDKKGISNVWLSSWDRLSMTKGLWAIRMHRIVSRIHACFVKKASNKFRVFKISDTTR